MIAIRVATERGADVGLAAEVQDVRGDGIIIKPNNQTK